MNNKNNNKFFKMGTITFASSYYENAHHKKSEINADNISVHFFFNFPHYLIFTQSFS